MSHEPIHIEDNDETTQNQEYTKKRRRPNKEKPPQELRKRGRPLDLDYFTQYSVTVTKWLRKARKLVPLSALESL